ncbi:hypothetical protein [Mucilaginibacter aquatilis]|uniref:Uncharacterized protein n=1 Tax=Mucilaginibacter aquatilis TaxID=1517760 RepID=A0A6I4I6H6_9SPHI|nr:hypothetical protein [Mucilaginibacter aquatilis]MVN90805.1 hypothetical protein [Mucilaginibacter aquatilis]
MKKAWLLFLILLTAALLAQAQTKRSKLKKLLERNITCNMEGRTISLTDTALYEQNRNVSYSYSYIYPKNFRESWPKEEVVSEVRQNNDPYIDTVTYTSQDKKAVFKIYAGNVVVLPSGRVRKIGIADVMKIDQFANDHIANIKKGKDKELGPAKIQHICKGVKGYNYTICVKANKGDEQLLYKIIMVEMPVSGDLIFSHFLYRYPTVDKDKYEALGISLAREFKADE